MQPSDIFKDYAQSVCDQIRWKKAKRVISEEIENHLIDQKDAYLADGMNEEAAAAETIRQMGDPVRIGTELDRVHRPKPAWSMIFLTAAIVLLGVVIQLFVTKDAHSPFDYILTVLIGIAVMTGTYSADFTILGSHPVIVYFCVCLSGLIADLLFLLSTSSSYFYIKNIALVYPLAYTALIYSLRGKGYGGLALCIPGFILPACEILYFPAVNELFLFAFSGFIILCVAIQKGWFRVKRPYAYGMILASSVATAGVSMIYLWKRLYISIFPQIQPEGSGYAGITVRHIISGAKMIGPGSVKEKNVLPAVSTDFLLTYLIQNVGWISFILIVLVMAAFMIQGFRFCLKQKSMLGLLVSLTVMLTFSFQTLFYILSNLGLNFLVFTLPLISFGRIPFILNMALIGIMLSVFRNGSITRDRYFSNSLHIRILNAVGRRRRDDKLI